MPQEIIVLIVDIGYENADTAYQCRQATSFYKEKKGESQLFNL